MLSSSRTKLSKRDGNLHLELMQPQEFDGWDATLNRLREMMD
jgi:hypothetical protein